MAIKYKVPYSTSTLRKPENPVQQAYRACMSSTHILPRILREIPIYKHPIAFVIDEDVAATDVAMEDCGVFICSTVCLKVASVSVVIVQANITSDVH